MGLAFEVTTVFALMRHATKAIFTNSLNFEYFKNNKKCENNVARLDILTPFTPCCLISDNITNRTVVQLISATVVDTCIT